MGRLRLFRLMARVDLVMGHAAYDRQYPNQAGGQANTVQSVEAIVIWINLLADLTLEIEILINL